MKLDNKDLKILNILKEDSSLTTHMISKKINIPITTIHNRIKKLEKLGIIKNYTVNVDNKKLGRGLAAYILITVDYRLLKDSNISQQDLAKKIKKHECVDEADIVTGENDIIVKVKVKDTDGLSDFVTKELRNIQGIEKTQTLIILSEV